jgi:hypothetical protein
MPLTRIQSLGITDGTIVNADINASAAIVSTKLSGVGITLGTSVASTSGTSIDFTGLPSTAKRITVMLNEISTNGTSNVVLRIGDGSIITTGYVSRFDAYSSSPATQTSTTSFGLFDEVTAATTRSCLINLVNISGNSWVEAHTGSTSTPLVCLGAGSITLSGALDRVRITTVNGTDTFDAGTINISYE